MSFFRHVIIALAGGPKPVQCTWCGATNSGLSKSCWKCGGAL